MKTSWNPDLYANKHAFVHVHGKSLIDLLDPQHDEDILDIGCGTGELTHDIYRKGAAVLGIDSSPSMVNHARETYPEVEFKVGDVTDFKSDLAYDALFSNAALHWVFDYKKAAGNMSELLKPGGRLVFEMGGKGNIEMIEKAIRKVLGEHGHPIQADRKVWYFPSLGEYSTVLESAGFEVAYARYYDRPTPLSSEQTGISDWVTMFGTPFLEELPEVERIQIAKEVQELLRPILYRSGTWWTDYKRLQMVAIRK